MMASKKILALAKLKASDMAEWPQFIDVESYGLAFQIGYKPRSGEYEAKSKDGDYFASKSLREIKSEIKSFAKPFKAIVVASDGNTIGHIMNQADLFFYRPAGTKGSEDGEKYYLSQEVLESLKTQGIKTD